MTGTLLALALSLWTGAQEQPAAGDTAGFDHPVHAKLFPRCETCHTAPAGTGTVTLPPPARCTACHDGSVQPRVAWRPGTGTRISNLRFDHGRHQNASATGRAAGPATCVACHQESDDRWMQTRVAIVGRCLDCHGQEAPHLAVPDSACAGCHLSLAEAPTLTPERIRAFAAPPNHGNAGFLAGTAGHGRLASRDGADQAYCATCHTRDYCLSCHVNGPETPAIAALAPDPRGRAIAARLTRPAGHDAADFERTHARDAGGNGRACATCHTRESCAACHVGPAPGAVRALAAAGAGRAVGAIVRRRLPTSHVPGFADRHAGTASAAQASCTTCHLRADCLQCHRPDPAAVGVHPAGFLARHPASAYGRETSCADCHDTRQFCAACHAEVGMTASRVLGTGARYHDAKRFFLAGHGRAARQNLESCVSCHAERDCMTCHSALGGRRFNPHGPGFDPDRLRRRNPEMCSACHGVSIPTVPTR